MYYDKLGRKTGEVDQANYITTYALDDNGNVVTETRYATQYSGTVTTAAIPMVNADPTNDRITQFAYDRNGRRLLETRKNVVSYTVSGTNGALTQSTGDASVHYTYNALGEVATKTQDTGDVTTSTSALLD